MLEAEDMIGFSGGVSGLSEGLSQYLKVVIGFVIDCKRVIISLSYDCHMVVIWLLKGNHRVVKRIFNGVVIGLSLK